MSYFLDIVDHAVEHPLDVHLGLTLQGEPIKSFVGAKVRKDRLDDRDPSHVDLSPLFALDLLHHELGEVDSIGREWNHKGLWATAIAVDAPALHRAVPAVLFLCPIDAIRGIVCSMAFTLIRSPFPFGQIYLFSPSS
jgi:hypothetical protein